MVRLETIQKRRRLTFGVKGEVDLRPETKPQEFKTLQQIGKTNIFKDLKRIARLPGKRISKTGKVYWETRKNRSDALGKRV